MNQTIIHSVLLFDGHRTWDNATVTFDGTSGTITSVSTGQTASSFPKDATVIDGRGHTLMPGLIEAHMHCHSLHLPAGSSLGRILVTPLKSGITTLCDMHSDPPTVHAHQKNIQDELAKARAAGKDGRVTMADLKSAHYGATIEGGWPKPVVLHGNPSEELKAFVETWPKVTVENAPEFIKEHKEAGANYIKLMQENCCSLAMPTNSIPVATLELQIAVVNAAHAQDMLCVGHALSVDMTEVVLKSGADGLTHTFVDQAPPESTIELYKKTNAFLIPTLAILSSLTNEAADYREKFADIAEKKGILDATEKANMLDVMAMKTPTAKLDYAYQTIRRLMKEGIDICAGTDAAAGLKGTGLGPSLWSELEMYVEEVGMPVVEALRAATSTSARRMKFDDRGQVANGKRADLLLVKGNVTERIQNLWEGEGIVGVWKEGIKAA